MNPLPTPHIWSFDALFMKAERYAEEMHEQNPSDWQFGFWSALTLEFLLRASVAKISPCLLADPKDWSNVLYATGMTPNVKKFIPHSVGIGVLLPHVENTFPSFTTEMKNFCASHIARRNAEFHSGDLPFEKAGTASWLPGFYLTCECLLTIVESSLGDFFGSEVEASAIEHIAAKKDDAAQQVKQSISARRTIWEEKTEAEREGLQQKSSASMTRYYGHRVACPSCECEAVLHGSPSGPVTRSVDEDCIVERQPMLPSLFECVACELTINGYSKLVACGLGDVFTGTSNYEPSEFFATDFERHIERMMEEDNNE